MDTPIQGAAWSVLHEHLPFYAGLLLSIPPVSFVLIKVALAARSAAKHKETKQWYVTRDQDQPINVPSASDARSRNCSDERLKKAVEDILRSAETVCAEEPPEQAGQVAVYAQSETTAESEETAGFVATAADLESPETQAPGEIVESNSTLYSLELEAAVESFETESTFEAIETDAAVEETEPAAVPSSPTRPCRQRRTSSQTSRPRARARRRTDSYRIR